MKPARILLAGIGNIFLGDDAFGVEMARRLRDVPLPAGVSVADFGIRGYDLACALVGGHEAVILIDAAARGQPPGTLYLIRAELPGAGQEGGGAMDGHSLDPCAALRMAASFGGAISPVYVLGCEPRVLETEDGAIGLSPEVEAAIPEAVGMIQSLLGELLSSPTPAPDGLIPAA